MKAAGSASRRPTSRCSTRTLPDNSTSSSSTRPNPRRRRQHGPLAPEHSTIRFITRTVPATRRSAPDRVKLCFDSVIKDAGIASLIQDGYLSPFHHYTIPNYTPADAVACFLRDRPRWGRALFYFHTLDQCAEADRLLRATGVRSEVVSGSSDRERQLDDFRAGRLDALSNCMVLSEGFDCPELKTVFCRPSCKGVTVQMGGRVLRKHPAHPFKQIVQCVKTRWPFQRTAAPALQYVWDGDGWRSLTANPLIHHVNGRTLQALARIEVTLPKFLTTRSGLSRNRSRFRPGHDGPRADD